MTETSPISSRTADSSSAESTTCRPDATTKSNGAIEGVLVGWKRVLYLVTAGIFFLFGALGALLPVLPATPFLLLTSYFLLRSSPRLNAALLRSRLFGPILTDWQDNGGIRYGVKLKAICVVVIAVGLTIYLSGFAPIPSGVALLGAIVGVVVILRLPTARE